MSFATQCTDATHFVGSFISQTDYQQVNQALKMKESEIDQLNKRLSHYEIDFEQMNDQIKSLTEQNQALNDKLKQKNKKLMKYAYKGNKINSDMPVCQLCNESRQEIGLTSELGECQQCITSQSFIQQLEDKYSNVFNQLQEKDNVQDMIGGQYRKLFKMLEKYNEMCNIVYSIRKDCKHQKNYLQKLLSDFDAKPLRKKDLERVIQSMVKSEDKVRDIKSIIEQGNQIGESSTFEQIQLHNIINELQQSTDNVKNVLENFDEMLSKSKDQFQEEGEENEESDNDAQSIVQVEYDDDQDYQIQTNMV